MPFYAEHQAFVDSNYTFRPNQSNVATENNQGGNFNSYPYGGVQKNLNGQIPGDEGLDSNLMMLPTPPSVQNEQIKQRKLSYSKQQHHAHERLVTE